MQTLKPEEIMKRNGYHKPTIEDLVEMSPIETLHSSGFALTRRTAELCDLKPGMQVIDVSSGRGTQAIFYTREFGVDVTGVDLSEEMIKAATENAQRATLMGFALKREIHKIFHLRTIPLMPLSTSVPLVSRIIHKK